MDDTKVPDGSNTETHEEDIDGDGVMDASITVEHVSEHDYEPKA